MRIKMRTAYASERATGQPGHILDLPEDEARNLIASGYATPVDAEVVESAVVAAPETAVALAQERQRGRKG